MDPAAVKVVSVVGARPQFIKAAVVSRALRSGFRANEVLVHTGQHYDDNMSDIFFRELEIPKPDHNLGIGSGSHGAQTGRMLQAVEQVLVDIKPDVVLVYGDTNSTLAGALAAVKLHIPVGHVEAGLRSYNRRMPEEINRVLTDHISDVLFAPSERAMENLRSEGLSDSRVHFVGDVMYDAALYYGQLANGRSDALLNLKLEPSGYILATVHRAENTDDSVRLSAIIQALVAINREVPVVLPMHPRTRRALAASGLGDSLASNLRVIQPVGYLDMIALEKNARLIVTDSGGVQKEAFFFGVPCVTLRDETEWVELEQLAWNRVVAPVTKGAVEQGIREGLCAGPGVDARPYGDGRAGQKIAVKVTSIGS